MRALYLLIAVLSLPACTAEQAYGSGQLWQQNQCSRIPDKAEFDRCMGKTNAGKMQSP